MAGVPSLAGLTPYGYGPFAPTAGQLAANRQLVVVGDEESHRLTLVGPKSLVDRAMAMLEELDVPQHQVTLHALIVDVSQDLSKNVGTTWQFGNMRLNEREIAVSDQGFNNGISFGQLDRSLLGFEAALNFVQSDADAKLLARPNVKALDGKEAEIRVGQELRFQTVQIVSGTAITDIEEVDVGILLKFKPRIANDGTITAELEAEASSISGFSAEGIPQKSLRNAKTTVRIHNGQTMVIGGLISEEEIERITKVPILGDIPFFGRLFRNRQVSRRPQELLVFLTPEIEYAGGEVLQAEGPTGF